MRRRTITDMKNTFLYIVFIASLCVSVSCKRNRIEGNDRFGREAAAIADSVKDISTLKRYVSRYDSLGERRAALLIKQRLGSVLRNSSAFDSAIAVHEECIVMATELKDTLQLIIALNNQGTNFRRIGDLKEASIHHYSALGLCDNYTGDTSYVARKNVVRTLNGLGNVMLSLGNNEVAEEMFRRALAGERELGSATGQAINYANIGAIKEMRNEIDSARIYYNLSMEKNRENNNRTGISLCYQNLGELDEAEGNYTAARENYLKSYDIGLQTKDIWHWLNPCISLSRLNLKEGKVEEAEQYNRKALDAAIKIKAKSRLVTLYAQKASIEERKGNYGKALECIRSSNAYRDSADIEENRTRMQNLRVNYEISKREKQVGDAVAEARHEKKMRRLVSWSSTITILLISVVVFLIFRAARERKKANAILKKTDHERREFYRSITHQLRTPLTVILGMTHELKRFIPENNSTAQDEFNAVTRKSDELLGLINEMIEYNRGERTKVEIDELPKSGIAQAPAGNTLTDNNLQIWGGELHEYVLIAEDDQDVALLITQMLKNEGYCFKWVKNGKEALDIIKERMPALVITDIMMPEMDGLELIKAIKANEETSHLPIIIVSARTENNDRLAGFDAGAEVYLGKPFIPDELLLMVRKLLEQREILKKKYSRQIEEADHADNNEMIKGIGKGEQEFIERINEYIRENIMDCELNAAMLASHMIMSIPTLNRKINSITGTNTTIYIRQRKLARAKYLLKNSSMSMGEIQAVCGFETPSYFSRTFKAEFGITPTEYRRRQ